MGMNRKLRSSSETIDSTNRCHRCKRKLTLRYDPHMILGCNKFCIQCAQNVLRELVLMRVPTIREG